jgi:hypothetical protein
MTQLKPEVGKKYSIKGFSDLYEFKESPHKDYFCFHPIDFLIEKSTQIQEHIEETAINYVRVGDEQPQIESKLTTSEEPMETKEEIKLEVGKKYDVENGKFGTAFSGVNPLKLLLIDNDDLIFRGINDHIFTIYKSQLENVIFTEHREMIKKSYEGWFNFYDYIKPEIFRQNNKREAELNRNDNGKTIYAKVTVEQLPEPKE